MELSGSKIEDVSLKYIKKLQSVEGDLEIARRVVKNDKAAVNYFIGEFSNPFLDYIGAEIMKRDGIYINGVLRHYPSICGEYYEFIGARFIGNIPEWHKVDLYKGKNDSRLYSYVNTITVRFFVELRKKELKKEEFSFISLSENENISILLKYDGFDADSLENRETSEIDWAWNQLPERDRLILQYLVIEERKAIDVFDLMIPYIKMTTSPDLLSVKQRQDAMSLLKQRAKNHLRKLIIKFRKSRTL